MNYFDTSIFIAAFQQAHARHKEALKSLDGASRSNAACSAHSLVEVYSVFTRLPPPYRLSPADAIAIVDRIQSRFTIVSLTSSEYLSMLRGCAGNGIAGGTTYDAIHVACAKKIKAKKIYTLDRSDFLRIDPSLATHILTP